MRLLLDTHASVWLASDLTKLPKAAKEAIANSECLDISVSAALLPMIRSGPATCDRHDTLSGSPRCSR
jgi:hypothetical protein